MAVPKKQTGSSMSKVNKGLGVRLFKRAPKGFDPIKARARELLAYGYPARPDVNLHPQLHKLWTEMISRPMQFIDPKFAVMADKGHGPRPTYALPAGLGWCGSISRPGNGPKGDTVS